jgi:hypothetical protein
VWLIQHPVCFDNCEVFRIANRICLQVSFSYLEASKSPFFALWFLFEACILLRYSFVSLSFSLPIAVSYDRLHTKRFMHVLTSVAKCYQTPVTSP